MFAPTFTPLPGNVTTLVAHFLRTLAGASSINFKSRPKS